MKNRSILHTLIAACAVAGLIVQPALASPAADGSTPTVGSGDLIRLSGLTPTVVLNGTASLLGRHKFLTPLSINLSLPLRNQASLDAFIATQASQGIYMTNDEFDAAYAPTPAQVQAVESWGAAHGLQTTYASPDGVLITLQGMTLSVESALHTTINDYRGPNGVEFFANSSDPLLPASLGVVSVDGLNSIPRFHTLSHAALKTQLARAMAVPSGGYFPSDFRLAYDVSGHNYDGTGQVIGLTLWGAPVPNSDLSNFATASGDLQMTGQVVTTPSNTGADQIEWVFTNGTDSTTDAQSETAMDAEYSHGMAPHAHLVYYLGDQTGVCPNCGGTDVGLENGISKAANNAAIHVVSDSWGGCEAPSTTDPFTANTQSSFQHAVAVGTTFYFSAGDAGTDPGGSCTTGQPSYPADSPYVVSVGGTALNTLANGAYSSESVWDTSSTEGGGAGCSAIFSRPTWQTWSSANHPNGAPACSGRAEPDVSMDADPATGANVYYSGSNGQWGGTSLAAPLFSGLAAVADRYASVNGLTRIGWAAPKLYTTGNSSSYSSAFHDITSGHTAGSISYPAQTGWDQATGWGSVDWWNWVQATVGHAGGGPTSTPTNTPQANATATNTPTGNSCAANGGTQYCLTGLSASASSVALNTNVTLTATANSSVGPSPWYLDIANENGTVVASCSTGTSCMTTVSSSVAATHQYTAYLSTSPSSISSHVATSNTVSVSWTGGTNPTATNTPVPAATATNTPTGNSCAANGGTQYCLTGLSASASSVALNTNVTLTATANPSVGPSPWYLDIANENGTVVASCSTGTSCMTTVSSSVAATHQYTAYLSTSPSSISSHVATSNTVSVSWTGGTNPTATNTPVPAATATNTPTGNSCAASGGTQYCLTGLSASASSVALNTNVTLTATANPSVGPSPWYLVIANENGTVVAACGTGTSCMATVSSSVAATHQYTAYLSTSPSSISSHVATSNTVSVSWTGGTNPTATNTPVPAATATNTPTTGNSCTTSNGTYCLTGLTASASSVALNTNVTLTATASPDVGPSVWYINIADENGVIVAACGIGTSCMATVSASAAVTHHYTAYLNTSSSSISNPGASSTTVAVSWH